MVKLPLIIHLISCFHFYRLPHCSKLQNAETPVNWLTVFTDGGGRAKKTALVRQHDGSWQEQVLCCTGLAQHLELQVFLSVFKRWTDFPVNIVTFSVCSRGDQKVLKDCKQKEVYALFRTSWFILEQRTHDYFMCHIHSHSGLPGILVEGNDRADKFVAPILSGSLPDKFIQVWVSHNFFHQLAKVFAEQFGLPLVEAKGIVQSSPNCHGLIPAHGGGC